MKIEAWERREGESEEAHAAFSQYRDMGVDRTLAEACRRAYGGSAANIRRIEVWSSDWEWVARCLEYDRYVDALAVRKNVKSMIESRVRRAELGKGMQAVSGYKVNRMLNRAKGGDELEEMAPADIARFASDGAKLEADALGDSIPTEPIRGQVIGTQNNQYNILNLDLSRLSDDELDVYEKLIAKITAPATPARINPAARVNGNGSHVGGGIAPAEGLNGTGKA